MPEILGKTLKKAREVKHLSIEEVSERTRIPKKIIRAMEEDRTAEVCSEFYVRGFIRTYAKFLGCEEEKAIKEYLGSSGRKKEKPLLSLDKEKAHGNWFIRHRKNIAIVLLVIFGIWILGLGVTQAGKFLKSVSMKYKTQAAHKKEIKKEAKKEDKGPKTVKTAAPVKEAKEEKTQEIAKADSKNTEGVELEILAHSSTWIQVESDNSLLFKGIFKKGYSDTWRAKKEIRLELGNAGVVTLKLNGKDMGSPGGKGEKKTIVVTKDGIR
ncbi:MAG: RodZ domain-containing protein [Candidatus Omnitrophota bacterium]